MWISTQKSKYSKLPEERKRLLDSIGFKISVHESEWQRKYELAKNYYEHHEHLNIPFKFKTVNGYESSDRSDATTLGAWINSQKIKYSKLSKERKQLLDLIGFKTSFLEYEWQRKYELAKNYYEHHGHLNIPSKFKTINGYEPSDRTDATALGPWIGNQKIMYNKNAGSYDKNRKRLLDELNMVWESKISVKDIQLLCGENKIASSVVKDIIRHVTYNEFKAKIEFLKFNNLPIVTHGELHEIFNMSSEDMNVKYGYTLETLINEFALGKKKGR